MCNRETSSMYQKLGLAVSAILLLAGCQSTPTPPANDDAAYISKQLEATLKELSLKAVQAKMITQKHQAALARTNKKISNNTAPSQETLTNLDTPIPMKKFYGDALQPLQLIAQLTGYDLQINGDVPSTETLWVSLHDKYVRTALDLLEDIGDQIDARNVDIDVWETPNGTHVGVILVKYHGGNK